MALIIPYEKKLEQVDVAYFDPYGNIEYTFSHEEYAREYCLGPQYKDFYDIKNGKYSGLISDEELLEELINTYHYPDAIDSIFSINEYIGTKLSKKELDLLKRYEYSPYFFGTYSDFMVSVLHFDKIQDLCGKRIITSSNEPHKRFYNYYLMDWIIEKVPSLYWNPKLNCTEQESYQSSDHGDEQFAEEINAIKRKVRKEERQLFFR